MANIGHSNNSRLRDHVNVVAIDFGPCTMQCGVWILNVHVLVHVFCLFCLLFRIYYESII